MSKSVSGKTPLNPRFAKKETDFFELKYAEIEHRQLRLYDNAKERQLKSNPPNQSKHLIEKVTLPKRSENLVEEEKYKEYQNNATV
jgi:hypothetical protein